MEFQPLSINGCQENKIKPKPFGLL